MKMKTPPAETDKGESWEEISEVTDANTHERTGTNEDIKKHTSFVSFGTERFRASVQQ
jgi:hypothetical protein